MKLSRNFSLSEFTASQTAVRMGREIDPTEEEIAKLEKLCVNVLQPIRNTLRLVEPDARIHITSGLRPAWLNKSIGGAKKSQHMKGEAADWVVSGCRMTLLEICEMIVRLDPEIPFDQLINEGGQWVHISHNANPRGEVLTAIFERVAGRRRTTYYYGLLQS